MSSANPPTYNFNGINYNPQFYASSSSSSSINSALYMTTTTAQTVSGQKTYSNYQIFNEGVYAPGMLANSFSSTLYNTASTTPSAFFYKSGLGDAIVQANNGGGSGSIRFTSIDATQSSNEILSLHCDGGTHLNYGIMEGDMMLNNGWLSVNKLNPTVALDVNGQAKISGLLTASNGFTVSSGTVTFPANSISSSAINGISNIYCDLTSTQTVGGAKTFTSALTTTDVLTVGSTSKVNTSLSIIGKYGTSSSNTFVVGIANSGGNYALDAVAGDSVIRNNVALTNNMLITNNPGGASAIKIDTSNNVNVLTSLTSAIAKVGDTSANNSYLEFQGGGSGVNATSYIDFHSGYNADYDSRIIAQGGAAGAGQGTLAIVAANINLNGSVTVNGSLTTTGSGNFGSATAVNPGILLTGKYGASSSTTLLFGIANVAGNYASDAVAGDSVIRNNVALTNNMLITNNPGGTSAIKIDTSNNVNILGTLIANTTTSNNPTNVTTTLLSGRSKTTYEYCYTVSAAGNSFIFNYATYLGVNLVIRCNAGNSAMCSVSNWYIHCASSTCVETMYGGSNRPTVTNNYNTSTTLTISVNPGVQSVLISMTVF